MTGVDGQPASAGPRLACDLPIERERTFVHNELVLTGWALSPVGISGVIVQVDDRILHASYGLDTPWLTDGAPDVAGAGHAGYRLQIDTSSWTQRPREVVVAAYDQEGVRSEIAGAVDVVPFESPKYTKEDRRAAIAAGEVAMWLERPSPADDPVQLEAPVEIAGWAYAEGGVDAVLVTLDGHTRLEALHPVFRPDLVEDYGEEVARQAGFILQLHPRDCPPGWHHLSVVATDGEGQAVGLEVDFECLPEPAPVEAPAPGEATRVEWLPEPRPGPPRLRPRRSDSDGLSDPGGPLHEAEREVRRLLAASLAAGREVLDVGRDDLEALPHDDASFDLVTCFDAIEHAGDPDASLEELRRVLRPDGVLLITARRRAAGERDRRISGGLERALRDRFANVRVERQQTLLASVIAGDDTLAIGDGETSLGVEVRKLGEGRPGGEDHMLAVAGDGHLPELRPVALLAPSSAVWRLRGTIATWEDRALLAEADAAASRNQANIARMHQEATLREWRSTQRQLDEARAEFAKTRSELTEARTQLGEQAAQLDQRVAELQQRASRAEVLAAAHASSLSWRITSPLRALKRGLLRVRRPLRRR